MGRFLLIVLLLYAQVMNAQTPFNISWQPTTALSHTLPEKLGLAGMAAAKTTHGFIIAGGANFPDALPWEEGKKYFSKKIWLWDGQSPIATEASITLPEPLAYAGYAAYQDALIIVGGETIDGATDKVYAVTPTVLQALPSLPIPVIAPAVAVKGQQLFVVGGDAPTHTSTRCWVLDLSDKKATWQSLPDLPMPTANAAIFVVDNALYVASGRAKNANGISTLNQAVFCLHLDKNSWTKETVVEINGHQTPFVASAFFTYKNRYLVLAGGDDGRVFHQIETYLSKIAKTPEGEEKNQLIKEKNYLVKHHQGFNNSIIAYDTQQKQWLMLGKLPFAAHVTTASLFANGRLYIFSGEVRPGIRSPYIQQAIVQ